MDIALFDIRSYLEEKGIEFKTSGKNVTSGWIELACPFCSDPSYHLGISDSNIYHCWRCGAKGSAIKLIMELEDISYSKAIKELSKYYLSDLKELKIDIQKRYNHNILPKEASKNFPGIHVDYLTNRNFPADQIISKYDLYACYIAGKYKYRLICPIIEEERIVNFTAIAVSGQHPKYLHCPNDKAIIPMKECLYNIDTIKDIAIIVEGVTDVWRIGDGAIATMGIEFTQEQVNVLVKRDIKKCFVMFDAEELAQRKAEKLAKVLSSFIKEVDIIELESGDPGDLNENDIKKLRENII